MPGWLLARISHQGVRLVGAVCVLASVVATVAGNTCSFAASGERPASGACSGPTARAGAMRSAAAVDSSLNGRCPLSQLRATRSEGTAPPACGECVPGHDGAWRVLGWPAGQLPYSQSCRRINGSLVCGETVLDLLPTCPRNMYCSDAGRCVPATSSPLFGAPCASDALCGPGLRCIMRRCVVCDARNQNFQAPSGFGKFGPLSAPQPVQPVPLCLDAEFAAPSHATPSASGALAAVNATVAENPLAAALLLGLAICLVASAIASAQLVATARSAAY